MNFWDTAANRMYYAIFHAVLALLIKDGYKASTHKGTMSLFGQYYVKTGKFTADEAWLYTELQSLREKSDYNVAVTAREKRLQLCLYNDRERNATTYQAAKRVYSQSRQHDKRITFWKYI